MRDAFGFRGSILDWFDSYLTGRTQSISVNNADFSTPSILTYGVPRGSVLGPSLFILYIVPLCEIISRFFIDFHADDNQLMFPINPLNEQNAILNAKSCLAAVKDWMVFNKLELNDSKTEILRCSTNSNIVTNCDVVMCLVVKYQLLLVL